jgi:hypothetical protein
MADSDPVEYADSTVLEVVDQVDPTTRRPTALDQGQPRGPGLVSENVSTCRWSGDSQLEIAGGGHAGVPEDIHHHAQVGALRQEDAGGVPQAVGPAPTHAMTPPVTFLLAPRRGVRGRRTRHD